METSATRTPWHLWVVGGLALLWNAYGCFDYTMSKLQGDTYLKSAGMNADQISHFHALPAWMTAVWAIGVWGAALGSILLLVRSRHAVAAFAASLIAYVLSLVYYHAIAPMPGSGQAMLVMQAVILLGCVLFLWYAMSARRRGVLR